MASVAAQRTGLITATAVSVIVALTALVFAFIFSAKASRAEADMESMTKKYSNILMPNALSGPTVTQLEERRRAAPFSGNEKLLDVAVGERDELTKVLGGTTPSVAVTAARTALKSASDAMKAAGLGELNTQDNAANAIQQLGTAVATLNQQKNEANQSAKAAKDEAAQTINSAKAQMDANAKAMADARAAAAAETDAANKDRGDLKNVMASATSTFEQTYKSQADATSKLSTQFSDLQREQTRVNKAIDEARKKLGALTPNAQQSVIRQADGTITKIGENKLVYISLGAGQQITPGMTFEVYGASTGVPPLKDDADSLPVGKASLEVTRVGANSSECRIIAQKMGQTVTEGDIIANLVYDRNTKYNFVVYGKFDLTKKGAPSSDDANTIKRLVTEFGGKVEDKIGTDTDFVVVGNEPQVPDFTEEQRRDPINAKILADAQAEVDAYNAIVAKAKELYIPVLNQNRFLYYTGYFDKARK